MLTHPGREVLPESIGSTRRLEHTATGHMVYRYHIHFACGRPWVHSQLAPGTRNSHQELQLATCTRQALATCSRHQVYAQHVRRPSLCGDLAY